MCGWLGRRIFVTPRPASRKAKISARLRPAGALLRPMRLSRSEPSTSFIVKSFCSVKHVPMVIIHLVVPVVLFCAHDSSLITQERTESRGISRPSHSLVAFQSQGVRLCLIFEELFRYYADFDHRSLTYGGLITMGSIYTPLDIENYEIRILTILPGPPTLVLRCTLEKTSLITPSKYTALSYCWGDPTVTENIIIGDVDTPVTVNLADALRQLRAMGVDRIWVDALCINQMDRQEKSLQIRNMKFIYSTADIVYAWLGKEGDGSTFILSFFESLLEP